MRIRREALAKEERKRLPVVVLIESGEGGRRGWGGVGVGPVSVLRGSGIRGHGCGLHLTARYFTGSAVYHHVTIHSGEPYDFYFFIFFDDRNLYFFININK